MSYFNYIKSFSVITLKYGVPSYFGYKFFKNRESRSQEKGSQKSKRHPSRFTNSNSKLARCRKKLMENKWVRLGLKPYVLGPLTGLTTVTICENFLGPLFYENIIGPLIQAYKAQSLLDECFDQKIMDKYLVKPLTLRLKEDDWPTNFAKLPNEMELEEKAQMCGLLHEDVFTLDPTASRVHFILSCIFFLSDLDENTYQSLLDHLARLLRAGKLSSKLKKYILMLLLRRGYRLPKSLYLLLKS